jgi:hypothetical protein
MKSLVKRRLRSYFPEHHALSLVVSFLSLGRTVEGSVCTGFRIGER